MKKNIDDKVEILEVYVSSARYGEVLRRLERVLVTKDYLGPFWVTTPNAEQLVQAQHDDYFRSILNTSSLALPDGISLVLASRLLAWRGIIPQALPERVAGTDVVKGLFELAGKKGYRVFLLGGRGGVARQVQNSKLKVQNYNSKFKIDSFEGAFNIVRETEAERRETLGRIKRFKPEILLVAYGAPWQERWVAANLKELGTIGVRVVMVVGGAFDILSGRLRRAPLLWQRVSLEWLWRLLQEPWRWRRQLRLLTFWFLVARRLWDGNSSDF